MTNQIIFVVDTDEFFIDPAIPGYFHLDLYNQGGE